MTDNELLQAIYDYIPTLINIGVWVCRLLCMLIGLMVFRFITLRSVIVLTIFLSLSVQSHAGWCGYKFVLHWGPSTTTGDSVILKTVDTYWGVTQKTVSPGQSGSHEQVVGCGAFTRSGTSGHCSWVSVSGAGAQVQGVSIDFNGASYGSGYDHVNGFDYPVNDNSNDPLDGTYIYIDVYLNGYTPITDRYEASWYLENPNPEDVMDYMVWVQYEDASTQVLVPAGTLYGQTSGSFSEDVERDSGERIPDVLFVEIQTSLYSNRLGAIGANWPLASNGGSTPSGGEVYIADIYRVYELETPSTTNPVDPELNPLPIDPTDPPEGIGQGDPPPESVGGDVNPVNGTATNYVDFRDAMIEALDARHLSQEELQVAYENALKEQNLSATNIYKAMKNALNNNELDQEGMRDAFQNALDRQGLSGSNLGAHMGNRFGQELDERNLNADAIGEAVAGALSTNAVGGDVVGKLDELAGDTPQYSGMGLETNEFEMDLTNHFEGLDSGFTNALAKAGEVKGIFSEWRSSIFELNLPESIGQNPSISFEIPGNPPEMQYGGFTVQQIYAEDGPFSMIEFDLTSFTALSYVRGLEVILLSVFGVFKCARIAFGVFGGAA